MLAFDQFEEAAVLAVLCFFPIEKGEFALLKFLKALSHEIGSKLSLPEKPGSRCAEHRSGFCLRAFHGRWLTLPSGDWFPMLSFS